ncbi:RebB family R body protein [Burkholderia alba]|uniref:RebB family R body protein n=1 Tax=Burkholderia alba TaxID=2683677 RepID=UPI002B056DD8|nr:RebB family R body protein [Burkholderia alba]
MPAIAGDNNGPAATDPCKACGVNSAITDAVTQVNVKVVGEAPAMAMGSLYQAQSHSLGILFENAVQQQSQAAIQLQTSTNVGTMQLYTLGPASAGAAATSIGANGIISVLADVLAIGKALGPRPTPL